VPATDAGADLVLRGVKARHYEEGRLSSRLKADELRLGRKAGRVDLTAPATEDEGAAHREIRSGRGSLDLRSGNLHLDDGVRVLGEGGATVEAPTADVDLRRRTAAGPDVVARDEGLTTRADRFNVRQGDAKLELHGNVRTTLDDAGGRR
jgi:LPS export ABC transporter protein LptC